jgi:hypothetical protein
MDKNANQSGSCMFNFVHGLDYPYLATHSNKIVLFKGCRGGITQKLRVYTKQYVRVTVFVVT